MESRFLSRLTYKGLICQEKGMKEAGKVSGEKLSMIYFSLCRRASRRFWNKLHHRVSPTLRQEKQSFVLCRLEEMVLWWPEAILQRWGQ